MGMEGQKEAREAVEAGTEEKEAGEERVVTAVCQGADPAGVDRKEDGLVVTLGVAAKARVAAQMVVAVAERGTMEGAVTVLAAKVPAEAMLVAVMAMVAVATVMEEIEGLRLAALEEAGKRVEGASAVGVAAMASEAAGRVAALEEVGKEIEVASAEGLAAMAPEAAGRLVANMA